MTQQITIVGRVGGDPELRFTPSGAAVCNFSVGQSERKFNKQANEWEDGPTTWYRVDVWRETAENVAESLRKGDEVIVLGRIENREYEKDGEKRYSLELHATHVGPSLRWRPAGHTQGQVSREGAASRPAQSDPWAVSPQSEEPPF